MSKKERFHFDDESEIVLEPEQETSVEVEEPEFVLEEVEEQDVIFEAEQIEPVAIFEEETKVEEVVNEEPEMPKKKKKFKYKFKVWHGLLLLVLIAGLAFAYYIYSSSQNDGPVYGERCTGAIALSSDAIDDVIASYLENEAVEGLDISVECLIIKIDIDFVPETSESDGCEIAESILEDLDVALGYDAYEGSKYSQAFNISNGEYQYDVEFIMTSDDSEAYPIFGTKHATVEDVSYTTSSPADQSTTDKVLETYESSLVEDDQESETE